MNIEVIKERLDAFALAEILADKEAHVEIWDNIYVLCSDGVEIFKMYVMRDSSLVFFIECFQIEAREFKKLIVNYSYTKNREVIRDVGYRSEVQNIKFSFQFHIFDQEIAKELVDVILRFRGGRK